MGKAACVAKYWLRRRALPLLRQCKGALYNMGKAACAAKYWLRRRALP